MILENTLLLILLIPLLTAGISFKSGKALLIMMTGVTINSLVSLYFVYQVFLHATPIMALNNWIFIDQLSAFNLFLFTIVFFASSIFSLIYFKYSDLNSKSTAQFSSLWSLAQSSILLAILANHIVLMWVGIEMTTFITAFLISLHRNQQSLEAMWKYLIICSVGVAFALIGTILIASTAQNIPEGNVLLWTTLKSKVHLLDPSIIRLAFIFVFVGYGTKAGLAPMHTWLPDAHGQAPSPVSALFSGFMINMGLYAITRFIPLVNSNHSFVFYLFTGIGLISIMIASAFIIFQKDLKRLLAYCSVEHMGIIALGLGMGSMGTFVALFHSFNHSVCKTLAFLSAGRVGQEYKTHELSQISNTIHRTPLWGIALLISLFGLIGIAPLSLFMSELLLVKNMISQGLWVTLIVFAIGSSIIFFSILKKIIAISWGKNKESSSSANIMEYLLALILIIILIFLGIYMPPSFKNMIESAANVINGVK